LCSGGPTVSREAQPVILEAAVNGVTTRERNRNVPRTAAEIAATALRCLEAGAAIVHNHVDDFTASGERAAALYLEGWRPILERRPDAILYPTLCLGATIAERYAHVEALAEAGVLRAAFLDTGSVNLGGLDENGLPGAPDFVYVNSFADIRHMMEVCERRRLGPSIAVFEAGFLRTVLAYARAGRLPKGTLVKLYFGGDGGYLGEGRGGVPFGLPPTQTALEAYLEMLAGSAIPWAVAVIGGDVVESGMARLALERGGHVRVGLEDYGGSRTPSNEELVAEAAALARQVGRPVATPAEAARLLALRRS
ncbi:MAG: 3-keto-5-aminohexanoate cleavage protein, partial [Candidatus Binatia bacterium]